MECLFCTISGESIDVDESIVHRRPENTILAEDDDIVVVPALGYFVDGYCLLISRYHSPAIADMDLFDARRIWARTAEIQRRLSNRFGPVVAFEHGGRGRCEPSGSCVDHAHIHFVPLAVPSIVKLIHECQMLEIQSEEGLAEFQGLPYVWLRDHTGRSFCRDGHNIESQYMRRAVGRVLEIAAAGWDWRRHSGRERLVAGLPELIAIFAT